MSALSIQPTYPIFTETDGQPLEDGYIWIGTANLDPQVNPINVYWDAALTQLAGQPIRTEGGYPANSGTPARLYVNRDYSIRVMNKNGSVVYSAPAATERYSDVVVSGVNAEDVIYDPPFIGGVQTDVEAKLAQTVSAKDFGAVGDGVTDDTAAIQAAIIAVGPAGAVIFPAGDYRTTATIEIPNLVDFVGYGAKITAAHNGVVLRVANWLPSLIPPGTSSLISGLRFANASGFTPLAYVEIGRESPGALGLNVTLDKCLFLGCTATYGVLNTAGYGTTLRDCVFNNFSGICVKTRQSPSDNPYWSYSVALYSCDITNITGSGLDIAAGDVMIYGGLIEGCSAGGIDFWTNASGTYRAVVGVFGTYFEGNQGHHIKCSNPGTGGNARISLQACRFTDGAYSSVLLLNNCSATVNDCLGIPSATITGGTVRISNSYGMFSSSSSVNRVVVDNWVQQTAAPATPVTLNKQINVNSSSGGGAALILCSHQNNTGNGTNAELFLIRYGNDGNNFAALSLGRSVGTDTNTYTFTVDANGFLQIASGAGNARYMVVANMCGFEVNF